MRDEPFYPTAELRSGVLVNTAWQFIAQFARRYAHQYVFSFEQIHPGISVGGYLRLSLYDEKQPQSIRVPVAILEFHLGGPNCGSLLFGRSSQLLECYSDSRKNQLVHALGSSNYASYYEHVAAELELPNWRAKLPRANRFAISMQFISLVQNFLSVYPSEFRPVCGTVQHSHSYTGEKADFQRQWAYQYLNEEFLSGTDFVGRSDEEISRLFTVQLFDEFANHKAEFVLHTSEAMIRLADGPTLREPIDIGKLYRESRVKFLELVATVAFRLTKK